MKFRYLLVCYGYWSRGETIAGAARQLKKEGARATEKCVLFLIIGDDKPTVNGSGYILRAAGSHNFKLGPITLGQALRMESEVM